MKRVSNFLLALILVLWATGTCWSFWYFQGQYMRPVERPAGASDETPDTEPVSPVQRLTSEFGDVDLSGTQPITVLNFWNPNCPCSRYAEGDMRKLIDQYRPLGVRFVTVIATGDGNIPLAYTKWKAAGISGSSPVADVHNRIAMKIGVWAAPAAVILDARSHIQYIGAYNAARYCSNTDTAFAAQALASIVAGKKPAHPKTLFFGCQLNTDAG